MQTRSIRLRYLDSGVVVPDDVVKLDAHFCEAEGSVLAHPDAVAPAAAGERIARNAVARVALVDNEELLPQPKCRADPPAFQRLDPVRADDLDLGRPPRIAPRFDVHIVECPDAADVP